MKKSRSCQELNIHLKALLIKVIFKNPKQLKLFSPFHNFQIIWGFFQIKTLHGIFKILNWIVVYHKKYF